MEIDPVGWAMAPGSDVAVIRVVQFSTGSGHQVREAVEEAVKGVEHLPHRRVRGHAVHLLARPGPRRVEDFARFLNELEHTPPA